jgi:hypothetical protein
LAYCILLRSNVGDMCHYVMTFPALLIMPSWVKEDLLAINISQWTGAGHKIPVEKNITRASIATCLMCTRCYQT